MDEEERNLRHGSSVDQEITSHASPLVMKRREMTAGFDERQKQLFNEALIAILTADMPGEKLTQVLTAAYDTTIHVFSWQMLAETRFDSTPESGKAERADVKPPPACSGADRFRPADETTAPLLLFCTSCNGHSLTLKGKLVQCDDCGTVQPAIIDQPRVVKNGVVVQELKARYFATGDEAIAALREEEQALEKNKSQRHKHKVDAWASSTREIVNVTLNGSTLVLTFHDGTIHRESIGEPVISAIAYVLRILDTMTWAREELENRLRRLRKECGGQ